MVRMGKVKFVDYVINFTHRIYENREAFLNYQRALELKYELLNYVDRKEYEKAFSRFDSLINEIKSVVSNPILIEYDLTLPGYLRAYKCGSVYASLLHGSGCSSSTCCSSSTRTVWAPKPNGTSGCRSTTSHIWPTRSKRSR